MNIKKEYENWLQNATADPDLKAELESVSEMTPKYRTDFIKTLNSAPPA